MSKIFTPIIWRIFLSFQKSVKPLEAQKIVKSLFTFSLISRLFSIQKFQQRKRKLNCKASFWRNFWQKSIEKKFVKTTGVPDSCKKKCQKTDKTRENFVYIFPPIVLTIFLDNNSIERFSQFSQLNGTFMVIFRPCDSSSKILKLKVFEYFSRIAIDFLIAVQLKI